VIRPPLVRNDGPELGHARPQRAYVTQFPDITKPRPSSALPIIPADCLVLDEVHALSRSHPRDR